MDESDEFNFFEAEDFDDINAMSSVLVELNKRKIILVNSWKIPVLPAESGLLHPRHQLDDQQ